MLKGVCDGGRVLKKKWQSKVINRFGRSSVLSQTTCLELMGSRWSVGNADLGMCRISTTHTMKKLLFLDGVEVMASWEYVSSHLSKPNIQWR